MKRKVNWSENLDFIKQQGIQGKSITELAAHFGVTRQRMKQVVSKYFPEWKHEYGFAARRKQREYKYYKKWGDKEDSDLYEAKRSKFFAKKANACRVGYSWSLDFGDVVWPTHCPILGIQLDYFAPTRQENSVSFDRVDSSKGYETGNVLILSWRANRIKNDGTAEEHRKIADFLDKVVDKQF